jgi:uncharacterized protein YbjT (DUF2867 family)
VILVVGATGGTGSATVRLLVEQGIEVRAVTRDPDRAASQAALAGAEIVAGDSSRPETLRKAFEGVEKLYLVPPTLPGWDRAQSGIIDVARAAGVRHVVRMSVIGASADAPSMSLSFHWKGERELERSGMAFTHVRPNSFFQNCLFDAPTIRSEGRFYSCVGKARFAKIDTRDIASVVATALTEEGHAGETYELTGPEVLSYEDMARTLGLALGRAIEYVDLSNDGYAQHLRDSGFPDWLADEFVAIYGRGFYQESNGAHTTDAVERLTGRRPRSFEQFARDYAAAFEPGSTAELATFEPDRSA